MESWGANLRYTGGPLRLHIADDGTRDEDQPDWEALSVASGLPIASTSSQARKGVGASLNNGFMSAFVASPLALYAVDDWALDAPLDLDPWVELLMSDDSLGMVRLGPPHPWIGGTVEMFSQGWFLRLDRHHYGYAFRPALHHSRLYLPEGIGLLDEGVSSLECERLANERWCNNTTVGIAYALPYPWRHIYTEELSAIVPEGAP